MLLARTSALIQRLWRSIYVSGITITSVAPTMYPSSCVLHQSNIHQLACNAALAPEWPVHGCHPSGIRRCRPVSSLNSQQNSSCILRQLSQRRVCQTAAAHPARSILCRGVRHESFAGEERERFPFSDPLVLQNGTEVSSAAVREALQSVIAPERVARIDEVVTNRTFSILPIVEGIYDMGNLAAVARSADALGCGAMHIINSGGKKYKQSARHSAGAEKWLDVRMWTSATQCLSAAKAAGYQVVVTHIAPNSIDVHDVDWTRPTAIVLGNEKDGVSEEVIDAADQCAMVPMLGMVESLNISVAAALMMNEARRGRMRALGYHADLTPEQQHILRAVLMLRHKGKSMQILEQLLKRQPPEWQQSTKWYQEAKRNGTLDLMDAPAELLSRQAVVARH